MKVATAEIRHLARKLPAHREGEVLALVAPQARLNDQRVLETIDVPNLGDVVRIGLPAGVSTAEGIATLEKDPRFTYVTSNDLRRPQVLPDDPQVGDLWGLERIHAQEAWNLTTGSREGPILAVLDTGTDLQHPDLVPNLWTNPGEQPNGQDDDGNGVVDDLHGYDAVLQTGDPSDDYGHGTHCAGTIAAVGNNGQGVAGLNWQARVMSVKMMTKGEGSVADTIRAVAYATRMGAALTSNSYAGEYNELERAAFEASPLLHICAAGNDGRDNDVGQFYPDRPASYPATYELDNILSVAASDRRDRLSSFSNYGAQTVDLAAPGSGILSTVPGGGYETKSGTSMATPHVAGVAGLIATAFPGSTPEQIKTRLLENVDLLPSLRGQVLSGGRLNAEKALENDVNAPAAPGAESTAADWRGATVAWTNTADDGAEGAPATACELRWRESDGREAVVKVRAQGPGERQESQLRLRPDAQERHLAVEVRQTDNVGNASAPTVVEVTVPAATVVPLAMESDGRWGQVEQHGRGQVWTDSPNGVYENKVDSSLTSQELDLAGLQEAQLSFEARYRTEAGADGVTVEAREVGQETWSQLEEFSGFREWRPYSVDLGAYAGKKLQLRFRMQSDGSKVEEGFFLDRLQLAGKS